MEQLIQKLKQLRQEEKIYRDKRKSCELIESDEFNQEIEKIKFLLQQKSNIEKLNTSYINIDIDNLIKQTKINNIKTFLLQIKSNMRSHYISLSTIDTLIHEARIKSHSFQPEWSKHNNLLQQCKKDISRIEKIIRTNEKTINAMKKRHFSRHI